MLERNLYNYGYNYRNYRRNYYPTFYPTYNNPSYTAYNNPQQVENNIVDNTALDNNVVSQKETLNTENSTSNNVSEENKNNETKKEDSTFRFGPITLSENRVSLFGFSMALDDLIILAIALFLIMENSYDYALLIVLGLLLLDSHLGGIGDLGFLKSLNFLG